MRMSIATGEYGEISIDTDPNSNTVLLGVQDEKKSEMFIELDEQQLHDLIGIFIYAKNKIKEGGQNAR